METKQKYNAWKALPNGEPVEGTDKILVGVSKRAIMKHLAYEEGVEYKHNDLSVLCKDGTTWHASKI